MPTLADIKLDENIVALACGKGGSGKSTALASFPKPIYIFDIEQRIKGILGSDIISDDDRSQIHFDQYDAKNGFKAIDEKLINFSQLCDKRELKFKTIIVESADALCEMLLVDSFNLKTGNKPIATLKPGDTKGTNIIGNVAIPTPDDYKYVYTAFRKIYYNYFKYFKKCNVILSAGTTPVWGPNPKEKENKYASDIVVGRRIFVPNQLADMLPRWFDEVWEFNKEETGAKSDPLHFTVQFRSELAKTCFSKLPAQLDITNKNFFNEVKRFLPQPAVEKIA